MNAEIFFISLIFAAIFSFMIYSSSRKEESSE